MLLILHLPFQIHAVLGDLGPAGSSGLGLQSLQGERWETASRNGKLLAGRQEVGGQRDKVLCPPSLRGSGFPAAASSPCSCSTCQGPPPCGAASADPAKPLPACPRSSRSSRCCWSLGASPSSIDSLHSTQASENSIFVFINPFSTSTFLSRKEHPSRTPPALPQ